MWVEGGGWVPNGDGSGGSGEGMRGCLGPARVCAAGGRLPDRGALICRLAWKEKRSSAVRAVSGASSGMFHMR
jgi:hypothetical protein